jgi:hypothetical protein
MPFSLSKESKIFLIILVFFLSAGLIAVKAHSVLSIFERDGTEFLFDVQRILNGEGYDSDFWPFGYMATTAAFSLFLNMDHFTSAKLVSLISSICVLWLAYLIGKEVFSSKVALVGTLILATNPLFFSHVFLVETVMLFTVFFLLSIYSLIKSDGVRYFLMAGGAAGLAYIVKYGVYSIFPVALLLSCTTVIEKGVLDTFKKAGVFIAAFLVFSSPWLVYNTVKNGGPFYSKHHVNIAWGMNRPKPMPKEYWLQYQRLNEEYTSMKDVLSDTEKFLRNWVRNIRGLPLIIKRIMPFSIIFLLPAVFIAFKALDRRRLILILISFSYLCLVTIAYTWNRYLLPIVPAFSIFVAYGVYEIVPRTFNPKLSLKLISFDFPFRVMVIAVLILLCSVQTFTAVKKFMQTQQVDEYRVVGAWLKERLQPDDWLMTPEPMVAYYAGTDRYVKYPRDQTVKLEDAVKKREQTLSSFRQEALSSPRIITDIDYFIYDKRWIPQIYPFDSNDADVTIPSWFIPEFSTKGRFTEIIVYRISPKDSR